MISLIAAVSKNRVIGDSNKLIWHLPADLKRFKELTVGHSIVMGRKTYESIGRPLPNRRNIIITRDENYTVQDCEIVNSIEEALLITNNDCFIIGGGEIYKQTVTLANKIYLTLIDSDFAGDTYFPDIDQKWFVCEEQVQIKDEKNPYNYKFVTYERFDF